MKKHLIAAAVAAAVAVPAAQAANHGVAVYGIVDLGVKQGTTTLENGVARAKIQTDQSALNSPLTTSRWGLRGTEDLGGGLKARFQLEAGLNASATGTSADLGSRASFIGLSGGFGEVQIGRQDIPLHRVVGLTSTGMQNNMPGSAYSQFSVAANTAAGNPLNLVAASFDRYNGLAGGTTIDRAITYTLPAMSGLTVEFQIAQDDTATSVTGSTDASADAQHMGFGARYTIGALALGVGYHESETEVKALNGVGVETDNKSIALGVRYNLGVATLFGQRITHQQKTAAAAQFDNEVNEVGVHVPLGATTLFASFSDGGKELGAAAVKFDRSGYQLGALNALSKRTTLYAIYGDQELKGAGVASGVNAKEDAFAFGVRHTF